MIRSSISGVGQIWVKYELWLSVTVLSSMGCRGVTQCLAGVTKLPDPALAEAGASLLPACPLLFSVLGGEGNLKCTK